MIQASSLGLVVHQMVGFNVEKAREAYGLPFRGSAPACVMWRHVCRTNRSPVDSLHPNIERALTIFLALPNLSYIRYDARIDIAPFHRESRLDDSLSSRLYEKQNVPFCFFSPFSFPCARPRIGWRSESGAWDLNCFEKAV